MKNKQKTAESIEDLMNEEYKNYYNDILQQMKNQGFSKIQIAVQEVMYKNRDDLFEEFIERYEFSDPIIEFTLEKQEE